MVGLVKCSNMHFHKTEESVILSALPESLVKSSEQDSDGVVDLDFHGPEEGMLDNNGKDVSKESIQSHLPDEGLNPGSHTSEVVNLSNGREIDEGKGMVHAGYIIPDLSYLEALSGGKGAAPVKQCHKLGSFISSKTGTSEMKDTLSEAGVVSEEIRGSKESSLIAADGSKNYDQNLVGYESQDNKEGFISEVQKIPETKYSKRVQDQFLKFVKEQQMPSSKKRPLEGNISVHNSFAVLSVEKYC
jgi:hypothetical protein